MPGSKTPARVVAGLCVAFCLFQSLLFRHERAAGPMALESQPGGDEVRVVSFEEGRQLGEVRFLSCPPPPPLRVYTARGWAMLGAQDSDPAILERLVQLVHDTGVEEAPRGGTVGCNAPPTWPVLIAAAAALCALLAATWGRARRARVSLDIRLPHAVPVAIQLSIYAYWWIYWPGVASQVGSIVLQIALAYALEAWLSFARFGAWKAGLGPLPMVLSANLFAWFDPVGSVIVIAGAVASKMLLRREGRHLLNPSAAGLLAGGIYLALVPGSAWGGLFHTQNLAPNMVELIVTLSVVPLLRFRLGLVPLGALISMQMLPLPGPSVTQPGTIIALSLFASDPATTPKTQGGRLLYGLFVGAGILVASVAIRASHHPDDFSKVVPVPVANLLAPAFDRLATRWERAFAPELLAPRWSAVALFFLLVTARLVREKPARFEGALFWSYGTPTVVRGADDVPRCADNPAFCRPFAIGAEIQAWTRQRARGSSADLAPGG